MQKFDRSYLRMAEIWAENSYCKRRKVGALMRTGLPSPMFSTPRPMP